MPQPTLPSSLSPHVCILASPDVRQVLDGAGLPSLPEVLQCFSPLPQSAFLFLRYECGNVLKSLQLRRGRPL